MQGTNACVLYNFLPPDLRKSYKDCRNLAKGRIKNVKKY